MEAKKAVQSHLLTCITIRSGFLDHDCNWTTVLSLSSWVTYEYSLLMDNFSFLTHAFKSTGPLQKPWLRPWYSRPELSRHGPTVNRCTTYVKSQFLCFGGKAPPASKVRGSSPPSPLFHCHWFFFHLLAIRAYNMRSTCQIMRIIKQLGQSD